MRGARRRRRAQHGRGPSPATGADSAAVAAAAPQVLRAAADVGRGVAETRQRRVVFEQRGRQLKPGIGFAASLKPEPSRRRACERSAAAAASRRRAQSQLATKAPVVRQRLHRECGAHQGAARADACGALALRPVRKRLRGSVADSSNRDAGPQPRTDLGFARRPRSRARARGASDAAAPPHARGGLAPAARAAAGVPARGRAPPPDGAPPPGADGRAARDGRQTDRAPKNNNRAPPRLDARPPPRLETPELLGRAHVRRHFL